MVPLDAVLAVDVIQEQRKNSDGPSDVYIPVLRWRSENGDVQDTKLGEWHDEEETHQLANFLRAQVGIPSSKER